MNGQWFLDKVKDKTDLQNWVNSGMINAEDYQLLKNTSINYLEKKYYVHYGWNKAVAINARRVSKAVLNRMQEIKDEK